MNAVVILGHPRPGSLNHALAGTAVSTLRELGYTVIFHDLYTEKFDPVLEYPEMPRGGLADPVVEAHCRELLEADGIVIVHPNWWGQPPAILKGWVDRVFRVGVAHGNETVTGVDVEHGLLTTGFAVVLNTSETPIEKERELLGDPLETLWKNCTFRFCGVTNFFRKVFAPVMTSTFDERTVWLQEARDLVIQAHRSIV